ncbi:MAG: type IV toxin-antitoxin system AbiEi family antitoxin [Treponema sp.]|nr:type IV toxin-antitoxin system AbiEi family antitoxin [Treponema sp.]
MTTQNTNLLNSLVTKVPNDVVLTSKWLREQGFSRFLVKYYHENSWLKRIAQGVYIKSDGKFTIDSAVYALQSQLGLSIHVGGVSALAKQGVSHNIGFNRVVHLYGKIGEALPKWFKDVFYKQYNYFTTQFLPDDVGLTEENNGSFNTQISSKERAILEMLYLSPEKTSLKETYQLMELMLTLRPDLLQKLLVNCSSVKVKRLFLYIAEKVDYPAFGELDLSKIDLGKGKRVIIKGGTFNKKYDIVINNIEEI